MKALLLGLAAAGALAGCSEPPPPAAGAEFAGVWLDRSGALLLSRGAEGVEGRFLSTSGARHPVRGRVVDDALVFTYGGSTPSGEGRIELAAGGEETIGTLTPAGERTPHPWRGIRLVRDPEQDVQALIDALRLEDHRRRRAAVDVLGLRGAAAREAVPALVEALGDDDPDVADAAELALARIGPAGAPELLKLMCGLRSRSARVRAGAAEALGRLGPAAEPAIELLEAARGDEDPAVRRAVDRAIRRIRAGGAATR